METNETTNEKTAAHEAHQITPLHDLILIRIVPDDRTEGGIVIPKGTERARVRATVVAVGPGALLANGAMRVPPPTLVGKSVLVNPRANFAGVALHAGMPDEQLALVDYESVWAIDERREGTRRIQ